MIEDFFGEFEGYALPNSKLENYKYIMNQIQRLETFSEKIKRQAENICVRHQTFDKDGKPRPGDNLKLKELFRRYDEFQTMIAERILKLYIVGEEIQYRLDALSPLKREVVRLFYIENKPTQVIANELSISDRQVYRLRQSGIIEFYSIPSPSQPSTENGKTAK